MFLKSKNILKFAKTDSESIPVQTKREFFGFDSMVLYAGGNKNTDNTSTQKADSTQVKK